ncbi:MAG: coat protein [Cressdnaviricota sp.]|nr:MAG: coat protein [Cressdnaviricota sp.]
MKRKAPFGSKPSVYKKAKKDEPALSITPVPRYYSVRRGPEKKYIDTSQAVGALAAASITLLNGTATGTDFTNRIGREILMKSIYLRLTAYNGTDQDASLRIMLVYDKQPNGATPAITDILTASDIISPNNLNNKDRFTTISDKVRKISTASDRGFWHKKYKYIQYNTQYSGTTNVINSIASGALWLVLIPIINSTGASTANFVVGYTNRVRFVDM